MDQFGRIVRGRIVRGRIVRSRPHTHNLTPRPLVQQLNPLKKRVTMLVTKKNYYLILRIKCNSSFKCPYFMQEKRTDKYVFFTSSLIERSVDHFQNLISCILLIRPFHSFYIHIYICIYVFFKKNSKLYQELWTKNSEILTSKNGFSLFSGLKMNIFHKITRVIYYTYFILFTRVIWFILRTRVMNKKQWYFNFTKWFFFVFGFQNEYFSKNYTSDLSHVLYFIYT